MKWVRKPLNTKMLHTSWVIEFWPRRQVVDASFSITTCLLGPNSMTQEVYETCSTCFLNHILCLYTCSKCLLLQITLHWKIILHLFMKGKSNINVTIVVLLLIIFLSWNIILHLFMKEKSNIIVIDVVLILRHRLTLKIIFHQSMKVKRLILKIR